MDKNQITKELLINHYKLYPNLKIQDLFKFIYQSTFGCEHLVSSLDAATNYISEEYNNKCDIKEPIIEKLDGNYSRVPLVYIDKGISVETFSKLFYYSAKKEKDGLLLLEEKLDILSELVDNSILPFSKEELNIAISKWKANGYPAIHHSNEFRNSYKPSYRLISNNYITYLPLFIEIDKLLLKGNVIVVIDGGSASGKSTLSKLLEKLYDCNIFHMDDFFLQQHQRTKERLKEIGGNIDKERFLKEILVPLSNKDIINYHKFDCSTMRLGENIEIKPKKLTIIEGVYSMHPEFEDFYNLSVFLNIDDNLQEERILNRNTPYYANRYLNEWIPLENIYFEKTNITKRCNVLITMKK